MNLLQKSSKKKLQRLELQRSNFKLLRRKQSLNWSIGFWTGERYPKIERGRQYIGFNSCINTCIASRTQISIMREIRKCFRIRLLFSRMVRSSAGCDPLEQMRFCHRKPCSSRNKVECMMGPIHLSAWHFVWVCSSEDERPLEREWASARAPIITSVFLIFLH